MPKPLGEQVYHHNPDRFPASVQFPSRRDRNAHRIGIDDDPTLGHGGMSGLDHKRWLQDQKLIEYEYLTEGTNLVLYALS